MVNNIEQLGKLTTKLLTDLKDIAEAVNVDAEKQVSKHIDKMTTEDAVKFRNFVNAGGIDKLFQAIVDDQHKGKE